MERQTGEPRPGFKSSTWPSSVSRSTDRVTQDNGIDPKPFWRLRAIPRSRTSSCSARGAPRGSPRRRQLSFSASDYGLGRKMGTATNSLAVMPSKQRTQHEANWLAVPDFSPIPYPFHGRKFRNSCHRLPPTATQDPPGRYLKDSI